MLAKASVMLVSQGELCKKQILCIGSMRDTHRSETMLVFSRPVSVSLWFCLLLLMDLLLTHSLLAVAEHGTIGEAAARLGVSQSALSRRIQQFEEEMGAELVERSGRGVALTEAGHLVVTEGALLVERYRRMKGAVLEHLRLDAGTVRIGGGATAVSYLLPQAMARFRRKHPKIRFRLEEAGSRQVETAV
ncbi:MAG: LysR family transcriptional regulator, partial [Methyloceanibacter sp.]|nr:LysR family transcriptional regulator [Methyloceanibacter sp.]